MVLDLVFSSSSDRPEERKIVVRVFLPMIVVTVPKEFCCIQVTFFLLGEV